MNTTSRNSIIWVVVLLVEALILKLAKSMRLWIYIALPIVAGFAAIEFLNSELSSRLLESRLFEARPVTKKRNLK